MDVRREFMKTCDLCKARKVRCIGARHQGATGCNHCVRRNEVCHFSPKYMRKKRETASCRQSTSAGSGKSAGSETSDGTILHHSALDSNQGMPKYDGLQELYIDRLLAASDKADACGAQSPSLQGLGVFGSEYSLTFFPEARLSALAAQLGHDRVCHVRTRVANIIAERMRTIERVPAPAADSDRINVFGMEERFIGLCVQSYFEHIDPIHPFLDKQQFESIALSPNISERLASDKSWSILFYAVLALGAQYHDGGSYQPAKNVSWRFFATGLALCPDLLITKATLTTVQALTTMAIFASNVSCLQIEYAMVSEGAKRAQALGYNRSITPGDDPRNRTFWVLYFLEKNMTFNMGRSSTIMDSDISSPIPSQLLQYSRVAFDWTRASIRISRLLSRIYASLFSVSVRGKSSDYYSVTVCSLKAELEAWAGTIPIEFRPGQPIRPHAIQTSQMMDICLRLHYLYHGTLLHLDRTALQLVGESSTQSGVVTNTMRTARAILELTKYIDVQPYTPLWILAGAPLAALLVLFDLVIDNPTHPETAANLALLDVGSGHFSGLEYASRGTLPGSIISEFTQIARAYVREKSDAEMSIRSLPSLPTPWAVTSGEMPETILSELSSAFDSYTDLQHFPHGWNARNSDGMVPGTDMLGLFGSYFPIW